MRIPTVSKRQWKLGLCLGVLFFGLLCGLALSNWRGMLVPGVAGTLGFDTDTIQRAAVPITILQDDSPLKAFGAKLGDPVLYDDPTDQMREDHYKVGESIGVQLGTGPARRHVVVEAIPMRHIDSTLFTFYLLVVGNSILAVVLATLIGLRRAGSVSARILAVVLLAESYWSKDYVTMHAIMVAELQWLNVFIDTVNFCGIYLFTCLFPDDASRHVRPWVRSLGLICMTVKAALMLGFISPLSATLAALPPIHSVGETTDYLLLALAGINLAQAFSQSSGSARQRVQWVGAAMLVKAIMYGMLSLRFLDFIRSIEFAWTQMAVTAAANIVMAYGILRHRVFDIGFAINRALVYAIVSATMLVSFGLLEWLAHHFVSGGGEESEKSMVLDAAIALGLYLGFHRLKHSVDHWVEKLFFHHWHENETRLRRFVRQAMHITSAPDLEAAYLAALQRFTHDAGAVLYRRRDEGYERSGGASMEAPHQVGINDALAVALRTEHAPVLLADSDSGLPGELALPMSFRGELQGFALIGQKPTRNAYRTDEIAALDYATQQVGLDLHALQTEELQAELVGLRRELGALQGAFERYAGGRVA